MHHILHKLEDLIDKLIPPALMLLAGVIAVEIFFPDFAHQYHSWVLGADYFVLWVFVIDVIFKFIRIKKIPRFLKECWIDIIAIFPFATFFRLAESAMMLTAGIRELVATGQPILHEGVEIQKSVARIMRQAESVGKVSRIRVFLRSGRFVRIFRIFARSPRFLKAFAFYEKPSRHPVHGRIVLKKKARPLHHHEYENLTKKKGTKKRSKTTVAKKIRKKTKSKKRTSKTKR